MEDMEVQGGRRMKKEEIKELKKEIDKVIDGCEDDFEIMACNPDHTFWLLEQSSYVLRCILNDEVE